MKRDDNQNKQLSELLQSWKGINPSPAMCEKVKARVKGQDSFWKRLTTYFFTKKTIFLFVEVVGIVIVVVLFNHVFQKPTLKSLEDAAVINLYIEQHLGAIDQIESSQHSSQPVGQKLMSRRDVLYYEFIDDYSKFRGPGLIFRGPQSSQENDLSTDPAISKGQTLSLAQAQRAADFELVSPEQLHTRFELQSIRKIEGFNCLQMIYSDGLGTLSMFQQPSNSEDGLVAKDFREYAVFRSEELGDSRKGKSKATILAWNSRNVFFVLIGQEDMSEMMAIAQSVSDLQEQIDSIKSKR
jgi:hypothetical protein